MGKGLVFFYWLTVYSAQEQLCAVVRLVSTEEFPADRTQLFATAPQRFGYACCSFAYRCLSGIFSSRNSPREAICSEVVYIPLRALVKIVFDKIFYGSPL